MVTPETGIPYNGIAFGGFCSVKLTFYFGNACLTLQFEEQAELGNQSLVLSIYTLCLTGLRLDNTHGEN